MVSKTELVVGQVIDATIEEVTEDGLKVRFDDYNGKVRVIDLVWNLFGILEKINTLYKVGGLVKLKVTAIDEKRFLGSVKELFPEKNPWYKPEIYKDNSIFEGKILNQLDYGYLVLLDSGAISHLADSQGVRLKEDDLIKVKIVNVDIPRQKISVALIK